MASNTILQFFLLHLTFLFLIISPLSSYPIVKPGCRDKCGKTPIPFPFGIGSNCSLGPWFDISCSKSTDNTSERAYLSSLRRFEVVEINPSQIRVKPGRMITEACYNKSADYHIGSGDSLSGFSLNETPFTFSDENWLTLFGCDDLVTTISTNGGLFEEDIQKIGSSCVSYCSSNKNDSDGVGICPVSESGVTSGEGCCVTTLPRGMSNIFLQLTDLSRAWRPYRLFSCSYVFIQEKVTSDQSRFSYALSDLNYPEQLKWKRGATPVMRLEWRINGAKDCSHARQNATGYACGRNSVCVDFHASAGGYHCRCKEGYQGNPYLTDGCQDIDECGDSRTNPCDSKSICTNKEGYAICSCPKGYHGDGRKSGKGCIPSKMIFIFIGLGIGLGLILLISICVFTRKALLKRKIQKRKKRFFKQNGGFLLNQRTNEGAIGKTQLFLAEELEKATDNFNKSRFLGQGGQGVVYKGMLSDGKIVAVKRAKHVDKTQLAQFINEVVILSQINHRNVVHLLGCCLETEVPLLVYEFLPNGTLSHLIHNGTAEFPITWSMRLKMAADIAGALAYLHSAASTTIYHRDIKSSNILLDEKYVAKVSDFGISRTISVDHTHLTTGVKGTFGYFDPEYFQSNQYTEKSDVYSFGVVLAELLTGHKPISFEREEGEQSLVTWFLASIEYNKLGEILDPRVSDQGVKEEVNAVALLASRCLNLHGKMRPTMKEVATQLESLRLSQIRTNVSHEYEETIAYQANNMMISDTEYTWSTTDITEIPPSSDTYPINFENV